MPDTIQDIVAEFDAFAPSNDSLDNEERLQILVDRWQELEDKQAAGEAMLRIFERFPENTALGEPGPLVHAIEELTGYEQLLAESVERAPSYYGVWMINRILALDLPPEVRSAYLAILKQLAASESAPPTVRSTAQEFLGFQEG